VLGQRVTGSDVIARLYDVMASSYDVIVTVLAVVAVLSDGGSVSVGGVGMGVREWGPWWGHYWRVVGCQRILSSRSHDS
jgi:hypothetical protein